MPVPTCKLSTRILDRHERAERRSQGRKMRNFRCPAMLSTLCPPSLRPCHLRRKIVSVNERHPLGRLIESIQHQNGWSDRDLQDRADRLGLDMSKSNFSRIKNNPVKAVRGSFIRELSSVLGVPQRVVSDAALASMGVEVSSDPGKAEEAIQRDVSIPGHDRRLMLALLKAMRQESQDDRHVTQEQEPGPEAAHAQHESADRAADGDAAQRSGAPIGGDDELTRRRAQASATGGQSAEQRANAERARKTPIEEILKHAAYEPDE
jgi:hypothetical protein